jgi:protein-S-isoprenylcysteine O-methyltransferase Ste14
MRNIEMMIFALLPNLSYLNLSKEWLMNLKKTEKIFGVGLQGVIISLASLLIVVYVDQAIIKTSITDHSLFMKIAGSIFVVTGLVLHFWTVWTLRNWWIKNQLCMLGPFKYFRHPMYAAWISLISLGLALYLNSLLCIFWAMLLHLFWHWLVIKEEKMMLEIFKDEYNEYAKRTGRFLPRIWHQ